MTVVDFLFCSMTIIDFFLFQTAASPLPLLDSRPTFLLCLVAVEQRLPILLFLLTRICRELQEAGLQVSAGGCTGEY